MRLLIHRVRGLVLLCTAVVLTGPVAFAQPFTPSSKSVGNQRRAADQAFADGRYPQALELYRTIQAETPSADVELRVAQCLHRTDQLVAAYDAYQMLLRERGESLSRDDFQRVEQALSSLRAATAVVALDVPQEGATVTVDGRPVGTSPLTQTIRHRPGRLSLRVTRPGFVPFTRELDLAAGQEVRLTATLKPEHEMGTLRAACAGSNACELYVNGSRVAKLPYEGTLEAGTYDIIAKSPQGESSPRKVDIKPNSTTSIELAIDGFPGTLHIGPVDPQVQVALDGAELGPGSHDVRVPAGKHTVTLSREGFRQEIIEVTLEPGEAVALDNLALQPLGELPDDPNKYRGIYSHFGLDGLFGPPNHGIVRDCPAAAVQGTCRSLIAMGGQLDIRVGYQVDTVGGEGFLLLGAVVSGAEMKYPSDLTESESAEHYGIARTEQHAILRSGVGFGAAARVSSRSDGLRLSASGGVGAAIRHGIFMRAVQAIGTPSGDPSIVRIGAIDAKASSDVVRVSPLFIWGGEVQLGSVPGAKVILGLHFQLELNPGEATGTVGANVLGRSITGEPIPVARSEYALWEGPTFYFGPSLAFGAGR